MSGFILRRLGQGVISVLVLLVAVFFMARLTGDPLNLLLPADAPPAARAQMSAQLGLDRSLPEQFVRYITGIFQGDLGTSVRYRVPVWTLYREAFPNTLKLLLPALVVAIVVGIPLGVWSATAKSSLVRAAIMMTGIVGLAIPLFWLALVLIYIFAVHLSVLPSSQMGGLSHYVMPVAVLSVYLTAGLLRLIRSSMSEALGSDYVKLGRLVGLSERRIIWKHSLRNALPTTVSFLGVLFSALLTGSLVVEKVFAWPGAGWLTYDAIITRDFPVLQGTILLSSFLIVSVNILTDIIQAALDPRVRL